MSTELVLEFLLDEVVAGLLARGSLEREDVAGALLRMQHRVIRDEALVEDDVTAGLPSELAEAIREKLTRRFGLEPQLFALEREEEAWSRQGSAGDHPWEAPAVRSRFDDRPPELAVAAAHSLALRPDR